ncbi:MAG: sensor histidine kinase [Treponemataceae bacterium]|nr:sensor histidine kinase [Treponemataceae bacterium]
MKSKKNLKSSNEYILYTIQGQEAERAHIARELHDTVAQDLRYCRNLLQKKDAHENMRQVVSILEKTLTEVRQISYNLSPTDITKKDIKASLVNLCTSMTEVSGISFRISIPDGTKTSFLTESDVLNLYRIVQESFTNVIKHANATEVVTLLRNETENEKSGLYIFISDDGCGFDVDIKNYGDSTHFGLIGMRKRSQLIGADLSISSKQGEGTQISIYKAFKNTDAIQAYGGI